MKWIFLVLALVCVMIGVYFIATQNRGNDEKLSEAIRLQDQKIMELEDRVSHLEEELKPTQAIPPIQQTVSTTPKPILNQPTEPQGLVIDVPTANSSSCEYARINSDTKLSSSLTWNIGEGGSFIGDLPKGTVVEITTTTLYIWNDYPNEHALYVKVAEAPTARQMVGQTGYIELKRINHKRCNLGVEFEQ
jgi:hypothetical protein